MSGSHKKNKRKARKSRRKGINSLLVAAAAIPSLGVRHDAVAQDIPEETIFRFQYSYYLDWQQGNDERMTIKAPMLWFNAPVAEKTEIEGGMVLDSVSGASVLYHDTLTGASGKDIDDERFAGDVTLTQHFDSFSVGLGANVSTEDDYDSQGGSLVFKKWTSDKNTVFNAGFSANHDRVRSTNNSDLDELRRLFGWIAGVTQVIDKDSLVQANFSYTLDDGYLSDPYKLSDNRPSHRDKFAFLTRYVRYIDAANASLHADYRYYRDSWDIDSHTMEVRWFQPLDEEEKWLLRPRLRYYTQKKAKFYNDIFPPPFEDEQFYTADYRLSGFGSLTTGLKLIREFAGDFSASIAYDFTYESNGLKLGSSGGSPGLDDIYLSYFSIAFAKRF